jgi:hypothetical protein
MDSARRHALNNLHLESLANSAMNLIENDQTFVRLMNRVMVIIQGDDPNWQETAFEDYGDDIKCCREKMQASARLRHERKIIAAHFKSKNQKT